MPAICFHRTQESTHQLTHIDETKIDTLLHIIRFRFASVLGRILSELAIDDRTEYDISGFSLDREALTDPNFKPLFQLGITKLQEAKL